MSAPPILIRHIRVGGRTLCGLRPVAGIHVVTWNDYQRADCVPCLTRRKIIYEDAAVHRRRQAKETARREQSFKNRVRMP